MLAVFTVSTVANSQYQNYSLKEHFDYLYAEAYQDAQQHPYEGFENFQPIIDGDGNITRSSEAVNLSAIWCQALEGLLVMYETTDDKGYLYEFMKQATGIVLARRDHVFNQSYHPLWYRRTDYNGNPDLTSNGTNTAFNGRILMILAHFNYIVQSDYNLIMTDIKLYGNENRTELYHNHNTFGEYANWIESEVDETLKWAITFNPNIGGNGRYNYWYEDGCGINIKGIPHDLGCDQAGEINFQAPWAVAFLYMYIADNHQFYNYGVKTVQMAQAMFSVSCNPATSRALQHETVNGNNGYYWMHNPWRDWRPEGNFIEDIGHSTNDIIFPIVYNRYKSLIHNHVTTGQYFEAYHMVRFRNTLTQKLWDSDLQGFHTFINGTSGTVPLANPDYEGREFNHDKSKSSALSYMPLYEFDEVSTNTPPNVYNILMDLYGNHFQSQTDYTDDILNNGSTILGFANLVAAQWDKECYNLHLNNKIVYYDEEFYAKNNLFVGDHVVYEHDNAVGNPAIISAADAAKFIIKSGNTVHFEADNQVYIGSSFEVEPGAYYTVTEHYNNCGDRPMRKNHQNIAPPLTFEGKSSEIAFNVFPNPANNLLHINFNGSTENLRAIYLINAIGEKIEFGNGFRDNLSQVTLSTAGLPNGFYFVVVNQNGKVNTKKVVISH